MAIIDVLTVYGARKRAAHAAKTFKTRVSVHQGICLVYFIIVYCSICFIFLYLQHGGEISTVNPELYARRFLEFMAKIME